MTLKEAKRELESAYNQVLTNSLASGANAEYALVSKGQSEALKYAIAMLDRVDGKPLMGGKER